ncbi:sigma-70 family RNA polymerase sigma factor [Pontibacillus salicampi]|uniref:Sigma-70 family RNA polymerase sigma factor n=1 Tax=Pontibacillus salicampi TaxID=1449801 RepID=A0ABV6LRW4_9BACI
MEKHYWLDEIMKQYGDELVRLAYTYVKDGETARDLVQNTFMKCYEKSETFRGDASQKTWLYRITINQCKDYLRSWHHKKVRTISYIQEKVSSTTPSAERVVVEQAGNEEIQEVLFTLPKKYREIIYLYYYKSLKLEEIASVTDLEINTVKTRLRRARLKLRGKMEEAGVHEG